MSAPAWAARAFFVFPRLYPTHLRPAVDVLLPATPDPDAQPRQPPPDQASLQRVSNRLLDAQSIVEMAGGDPGALSALHDRWADALYDVAWRVLRNQIDAEAVVEASFWQMWEESGSYLPNRDDPHVWIRMLSRRCLLTRRRAALQRLPMKRA